MPSNVNILLNLYFFVWKAQRQPALASGCGERLWEGAEGGTVNSMNESCMIIGMCATGVTDSFKVEVETAWLLWISSHTWLFISCCCGINMDQIMDILTEKQTCWKNPQTSVWTSSSAWRIKWTSVLIFSTKQEQVCKEERNLLQQCRRPTTNQQTQQRTSITCVWWHGSHA